MPSAIHQIAVSKILDAWPAAKTRGLMAAIRAALPAYARPDYKFQVGIPDAFIVDRDRKLVTLFEVEASHPVDDEKMRDYGALWWGLDGDEWDLLLITTNRWGVETGRIDIGDFTIDLLVDDARRRGVKPSKSAIFCASICKISL